MSEHTTTATTELRPAPDDLSALDLADEPTDEQATAEHGDEEGPDQDGADVRADDELATDEPTDEQAAEEPGRRVEQADDPAARAAELAESLGGDVAGDVRTAEAAVRARRDAARLVLAGGEADEELLARAEEIRAAAAVPPPIDPEQVAEIRQLAAELRAAARIRERTETRALDELRERLSASTGLTVHPLAVRAAADAVAAAAAAVADAELALAEIGEGLVMAELSERETHE